jgi:hypothetical protein
MRKCQICGRTEYEEKAFAWIGERICSMSCLRNYLRKNKKTCFK